MTENNKRYQLIKNFGDYHISNGEKHICYDLCSPSMAKENWNNVVDELNELHEEKEQLNYSLTEHMVDLNNCKGKCSRLEEENEQLKADNNRLVNKTAKIIAEHQGRVLDLIDKSLEKDKHYYEMSYDSYLNGRIEALEDLKKELIE